MKKKIFSSLIMVAFTLATVGTFVSCKDYDDDINDLQSQIDALSKKIDDINSQITAGSILTDVSSVTNGVQISLSNGKTYTITNGTNGTNGKDGADGKDGDAWTINEDGYWCKNGVATEYKAIGQDGKDGVNGTNGTNGTDGKDGVDGKDGADGKDGVDGKTIYYQPNADGYFHKVTLASDGTIATDEATNIQWKSTQGNVITAVLDGSDLYLYNVQGAEEDPIVISRTAGLRGLVFAGDNMNQTTKEIERVYFDNGDPGIRFKTLIYSAMEYQVNDEKSSKDSESEILVAKTDKEGEVVKDTINPVTYAYYHVNPANVNIKDLQTLNYVLKDATKATRAKSKNLKLTATDAEFVSEGVVRVKLEAAGSVATDEDVSVAALQATTSDKEVITSDYAALSQKPMAGLRLANDKKFNQAKPEYYHFRRAAVGIAVVDDEAGLTAKSDIANFAAWDKSEDKDGTRSDLELQYDGDAINLYSIVGVHEADGRCSEACSSVDLDAMGLELSFEVVKNYTIGTNNTDQADFIKLENGEISAKTFSETGTSAIDRTPIIRAVLTDKATNEIIEAAYIKVKIVDEKTPDNPSLELNPVGKDGKFTFDCDDNGVLTATVEQFNTKIYNKVSMTRKTFHSTYTYFDAQNDEVTDKGTKNEKHTFADNIGTVEEVEDETIDGVTTYLLKWTLTPQEMWDNAGKTVKHTVKYYTAKGSSKWVEIVLTATVDGIQKEYDITKAKYIAEYWDADKTYAKFNVAVPTSTTDAASANCVFVNDLNSVFVTTNGQLQLGEDVTYAYAFCKDMLDVKSVGGINVTFQFGDNGKGDGTTLYAKKTDAEDAEFELIATIDNSGEKVPYNTVTLNKKSDLAKELLNTNAFKAKYSVSAYACDEDKVVTVTFNGNDCFEALFVRPVDIASASKGSFTDGVDFGEAGSYINVKDLINPSDWRGRLFSKYENYWGFYGEFDVKVNLTKVECDLNGTRQVVPATIELAQNMTDAFVFDENGDDAEEHPFGYLTYKNNGSTTQSDFHLYVKAEVTYGWGVINTDWIEVKVNKTIAK